MFVCCWQNGRGSGLCDRRRGFLGRLCPRFERPGLRQRRLWRFFRSTSRNEDDLSPGMLDACGSEFLTAGSLQEQVDHLLLAQLKGNSIFIHTFFSSYRRCADTLQVLDLLFTRFRTFEAPMGSSAQTDLLLSSSVDVVSRDELSDAISGLLSTWLDYHPEDFLIPSQHACLQRLRAHLRLHMCGSDPERHVSHILAHLGIREPSQDEAIMAPAAAPLADVAPSWHLDSPPPGNAVPSPVGEAPSRDQAEATAACKVVFRPLEAKASSLEEEPCAGQALLPSPKRARAASVEVPSAPTLALAPLAQGAALARAELEPSLPLAPEPTGAEEAVCSEHMVPCSSFPSPGLRTQQEAEAVAEEGPVEQLAVPLQPGQAALSAQLLPFLGLALLLRVVGAPAGLLTLLGVLILLLCATRALGSCLHPEPHSSRASVAGAVGAAARTTELEPSDSWAPGLSPRGPAIGTELLVCLMGTLLLLLFGGPTCVLILLRELTWVFFVVRRLGSCATSVPSASVAVEPGAHGASDYGPAKKLASSRAPLLHAQGPVTTTHLEVFVNITYYFYLLGAPPVVLFILGVQTVGLCVLKLMASAEQSQASANLQRMPSADGAAASRAATEPPVPSTPPLTAAETASSADSEVSLPLSAVLSLVHTPALALCVGGALAWVLSVWEAPASKCSSWSGDKEPGSAGALELRPEDTAASREEGKSSGSLTPVVLLLPDSGACPGDMKTCHISSAMLHAEDASVSTAAMETPHTMALPLSAQGPLASGSEPEPPASVVLMPRAERASASLPHLQACSTLAVVMDQAPCASGESELKGTSVPPQEACPPPCPTTQIGRSQELPPVLAAHHNRIPKQLKGMDAVLIHKAKTSNCRACIWFQRHMAGKENLAFTIQAVVTQFNNMASCVITTCLGIQHMEAPDRASRMEVWIDMAVVCYPMCLHLPSLYCASGNSPQSSQWSPVPPSLAHTSRASHPQLTHCLLFALSWSQLFWSPNPDLVFLGPCPSPTIPSKPLLSRTRGDSSAKNHSRYLHLQGCRAQRNFSSLHAIISALQSAAILRFHSTWRLVSRDSLWQFKKLETITSQENNYSKSRELLLNETAKFTTKEKRLKGSPRWLQKMVLTKGTVPYLGMFLTDLLMTNNAYQDFNEERTMMRKLHKENAILQQLKLLPHSCSYYKIQVEATFLDWLRGLERLSEETSGSSHCASRGQVQPGPDPGSSNLDTAEEPSHTSAHCPGGSRNQSRSSLQGESCTHHEPVTPHPSTPVLLPGQPEVNKQEEPRDVIPKAPEEHWLYRQKPKGLQLVQFASEDLKINSDPWQSS
ncbi:uncharacterized protein RHO17_022165 [Thomomys bottae]